MVKKICSVDISKCSPLIKQYFETYNEYTAKYGKNTVVLMCVGSFYECYQLFELGNIKVVSEVLGMNIAKKSVSKKETDKELLMLGFPDYAFDTHLPTLIDSGFTVVKIDQFDKENSDSKERRITRVYSASTYIENETTFNNYLVGVNYEIRNGKNYIYFIGLDNSTGKCNCIDLYDTENDKDNCLTNFERHIYAFNPSEILLKMYENKEEEILYNKILKYINNNNNNCGNLNIQKLEINPEFKKLAYQNTFFTKVFSTTDINLDSFPQLRITLICVIQYVYEHDPSIIEKLSVPQLHTDDKILNLNSDAVYQLYLVPLNNLRGGSVNNNNKYNTVFNTIDFTSTNMGKRLLYERLTRPIVCVEELNKRYNLIDDVKPKSKELKKLLGGVCDLEKKYRKATLNKLKAKEFMIMNQSYLNIVEIFEMEEIRATIQKNILKSQKIENICNKLKNFNIYCEQIFDFPKLEFCEKNGVITKNIFKLGYFPEIDEIDSEIEKQHKKLTKIANNISNDVGIVDCAKICSTDSNDYYFSMTVKRAEKLKKFGNKYIVTNLKSVSKVITQESIIISNTLKELNEKLQLSIKEKYYEIIFNISQKYKNLLNIIIKIISYLDVAVSSAICSLKYAYNRPTILDNNNNKSYFRCKSIRHPIIERIIDKEYIGNDVDLGNLSSFQSSSNNNNNNENNYQSMLLYGPNASGKSSLLRSIGCNIVLAQAGLFVPSTELEFYPYKHLICKISCMDNLFKSQSTFMSELIELKTILRKQNDDVMVLADELCNGTESMSASALVCTTIEELIKNKTTFVISTHLHEIVEFEEIMESKNLQIYHMDFNYTYKLLNGIGNKLYGLEFATSLNQFTTDFLKRAYQIRNNIEGKSDLIVSTKKSRYNSQVYMDKCNRCGSTEDLCTHHVYEQHTSDKNGIINSKFHKNSKFNLEVLCEKCHIEHHHNESE